MNIEHDSLWQKIQGHALGHAAAELGFARRLARENAWSERYAECVVAEYRRFVYLAATLPHPATPSDQVDQAWHLHLTYTRDYWEVFCPQVLGQPLHHDPTRGGAVERAKFIDWYARTLAAYRESFGEEPPADIWPAPQRRFAQRFERRQVAGGSKRTPWGMALVGTLGVVGAAWGAQDSAGSKLIWFLLVIGLIVAALFWYALKKPGTRGQGGGSGCGGGGCGGGTSRGDCGGDGSGCGGGGCGGCGGS
jgi:hypothetical protein